jgi:hypothetical protein
LAASKKNAAERQSKQAQRCGTALLVAGKCCLLERK